MVHFTTCIITDAYVLNNSHTHAARVLQSGVPMPCADTTVANIGTGYSSQQNLADRSSGSQTPTWMNTVVHETATLHLKENIVFSFEGQHLCKDGLLTVLTCP